MRNIKTRDVDGNKFQQGCRWKARLKVLNPDLLPDPDSNQYEDAYYKTINYQVIPNSKAIDHSIHCKAITRSDQDIMITQGDIL